MANIQTIYDIFLNENIFFFFYLEKKKKRNLFSLLKGKLCRIVEKPVLPNRKDRFCLDQTRHMFLHVVHSG